MSTSHALLAMPCNAAWDSNDTFRSLNGDTLYNIILYILYIFTIYIYILYYYMYILRWWYPTCCLRFSGCSIAGWPRFLCWLQSTEAGRGPIRVTWGLFIYIYIHNILSIFIYCRLIWFETLWFHFHAYVDYVVLVLTKPSHEGSPELMISSRSW